MTFVINKADVCSKKQGQEWHCLSAEWWTKCVQYKHPTQTVFLNTAERSSALIEKSFLPTDSVKMIRNLSLTCLWSIANVSVCQNILWLIAEKGLLSLVSCFLYHVSCIMFLVSCLLYHVFCIMSPCHAYLISYLMSYVSCLTFHVSCLLSHISCLTTPVSCLRSHVSCPTSPVSRLLIHVSCITLPVSRLLSPVSSLLSHVSCLVPPVSSVVCPFIH